MIARNLRQKIEQSKSLEEAVETLFGVRLDGRTFVLHQESMDNGIAEDFDLLGRTYRCETYKQIAQDFVLKCYEDKGTILDVGCGSGLLAKRLSEITDSDIVGIDISKDMLGLAKRNCPDSYISFRRGSVYNLPDMLEGAVDYVICRNSLHRFMRQSEALRKMYASLKQGGMMYLRDLRRDADWNVVVSRIGEPRWKSDRFVMDYIGAMAQMSTTEELGVTLTNLGIDNFTFFCNSYSGNQENFEHGKDVEYTCIVKRD